MATVLVDTDILSLFFRNNRNVVSHFRKYLAQYEKINLELFLKNLRGNLDDFEKYFSSVINFISK